MAFYYCDKHNIYYNFTGSCPICMLNERMDELYDDVRVMRTAMEESKGLFEQIIMEVKKNGH